MQRKAARQDGSAAVKGGGLHVYVQAAAQNEWEKKK